MKQHNELQQLMGGTANAAKFWWGITNTCRLLIVVITCVTTLIHQFTKETAVIAIPALTIAASMCQWRSDWLKGISQAISRKFELFDGLGWEITGKERSDLLPTIPKSIKAKTTPGNVSPNPYFASKQGKTAQRLLENLEESSWWSKHLARDMAGIVAIFSVAIVALAFIVLLFAVQNVINQQATAENLAKVASSVIAFVFSGGYVKLAFDYAHFSRQAERTETQVCSLLEKNALSTEEAIKLLHEYQLLRATSPMLPSWLWRLKQKEYNQLWVEERVRKQPAQSERES